VHDPEAIWYLDLVAMLLKHLPGYLVEQFPELKQLTGFTSEREKTPCTSKASSRHVILETLFIYDSGNTP
jgi:hypothetical protein